jgi:hypothetical protein
MRSNALVASSRGSPPRIFSCSLATSRTLLKLMSSGCTTLMQVIGGAPREVQRGGRWRDGRWARGLRAIASTEGGGTGTARGGRDIVGHFAPQERTRVRMARSATDSSAKSHVPVASIAARVVCTCASPSGVRASQRSASSVGLP